MKASVILSVIASVAFGSYVPPVKSSVAPVVTVTAPVYVPPAKSSTLAPVVTSAPPAYVPPAKSSALPVKTSAIPMKDTGCTTTGRPSSTVRPVATSSTKNTVPTATRLPDVPGYVAPSPTRLPDVPSYVAPTATRLPDVPGYVAPKQTRLPDAPGYVAPKDAKLPVPPVSANDSKKDTKKAAPKQTKHDTDSGKNAPAYGGSDTALPDSSNALEIDASYAKTSESSGANLQTSALAFGSAVIAALLF